MLRFSQVAEVETAITTSSGSFPLVALFTSTTNGLYSVSSDTYMHGGRLLKVQCGSTTLEYTYALGDQGRASNHD